LKVILGAGLGLYWPAISTGRSVARAGLWLIMAWLLIAAGFAAPTPFAGLALYCLGVALAFVLPLFSVVAGDMIRPNYRGLQIPTSFGLVFVIVWLFGSLFLPDTVGLAAMPLVLVWAVLGLLDDHFSSQTRGFRGHLSALARGKFTTGAAKLIFGGGVSLLAAWLAVRGGIFQTLLDGLIIALCTNALNLLDLRPGRALKGFLLLGILASVLEPGVVIVLVPLFAAGIVYAPIDLGERAMMGDVGSNILGAMAGLALVFSLGLGVKFILLALLLLVHLYAEVGSITGSVERNRLLRWLDGVGRV